MGSDVDVFIKVLISIAAGIVAIGGAIGFIEHVVERATVKQNKMSEKVEAHEKQLEKHTEYLDNDNKRLKDVEDTNRLIVRGLMNLLSHEIDGNHTTQLEEVRNDMNKYLCNK